MRPRIFWIATLLITLTVFVGAMATLRYQHFTADRTAQPLTASGAVQDKQVLPAASSNFLEMDGLEFERKVVEGAPFSATLVIETVQALPNGNSKTSRSVSLIYRDAQGRTRRDRMPSGLSDTAITSITPQITTINDPITGFFYILEHRTNIARRGILSRQTDQGSNEYRLSIKESASWGKAGFSQLLPVPATSEAKKKFERADSSSSSEPKRELLGQREIERLSAEGTRITMSVPTGKIGNERPVDTIVERWYSSDLKTVLLIERSDPRFGNSVFRLTSIERTAPAALLFSVPTEFKIISQ
jgi:hypothetical protein